METENQTSENKAEVTTDSKMPRLALYCRVSTEDQHNENQKLKLVAYAASKNMPFDLFMETESSGKHRPVKENLLHQLKSKKYAACVVVRMDRWCRSVTEMLKDLNTIVLESGVGFISLTESLDFLTPHGRLMVSMISSFSQYEKEILSLRCKEGLKRAIAQGKKLGRQHGQKDTKPRKKSGYLLRYARKRQLEHQKKTGEYRALEEFLTAK